MFRNLDKIGISADLQNKTDIEIIIEILDVMFHNSIKESQRLDIQEYSNQNAQKLQSSPKLKDKLLGTLLAFAFEKEKWDAIATGERLISLLTKLHTEILTPTFDHSYLSFCDSDVQILLILAEKLVANAKIESNSKVTIFDQSIDKLLKKFIEKECKDWLLSPENVLTENIARTGLSLALLNFITESVVKRQENYNDIEQLLSHMYQKIGKDFEITARNAIGKITYRGSVKKIQSQTNQNDNIAPPSILSTADSSPLKTQINTILTTYIASPDNQTAKKYAEAYQEQLKNESNDELTLLLDLTEQVTNNGKLNISRTLSASLRQLIQTFSDQYSASKDSSIDAQLKRITAVFLKYCITDRQEWLWGNNVTKAINYIRSFLKTYRQSTQPESFLLKLVFDCNPLSYLSTCKALTNELKKLIQENYLQQASTLKQKATYFIYDFLLDKDRCVNSHTIRIATELLNALNMQKPKLILSISAQLKKFLTQSHVNVELKTLLDHLDMDTLILLKLSLAAMDCSDGFFSDVLNLCVTQQKNKLTHQIELAKSAPFNTIVQFILAYLATQPSTKGQLRALNYLRSLLITVHSKNDSGEEPEKIWQRNILTDVSYKIGEGPLGDSEKLRDYLLDGLLIINGSQKGVLINGQNNFYYLGEMSEVATDPLYIGITRQTLYGTTPLRAAKCKLAEQLIGSNCLAFKPINPSSKKHSAHVDYENVAKFAKETFGKDEKFENFASLLHQNLSLDILWNLDKFISESHTLSTRNSNHYTDQRARQYAQESIGQICNQCNEWLDPKTKADPLTIIFASILKYLIEVKPNYTGQLTAFTYMQAILTYVSTAKEEVDTTFFNDEELNLPSKLKFAADRVWQRKILADAEKEMGIGPLRKSERFRHHLLDALMKINAIPSTANVKSTQQKCQAIQTKLSLYAGSKANLFGKVELTEFSPQQDKSYTSPGLRQNQNDNAS